MLNAKSFLAIDAGAANLKLAEFALTEDGALMLKDYGLHSLGGEGSQETTREAVTQKALQELLAAKGIKAKPANICAPGFHTFSRFVKLPPVDTSKVTQIIQYEAQQNVPFPLEEVVWDYQILGAGATGELEVLLVAIKSDIVEGLFRVAESAGLKVNLVDVSPAALCNAFRYNYGDLQGCTMLLDIGAKTSNLLFFDKGAVYSRGINIGANSITQEFAKESRLSFDEAEKIKIEEGFVSLGGAYEEPDSPNQAAISKIARQVFTRLHIQVNQTVQFFRGQQGGAAPERVFLSGGASIMPYAAQFFSEKLNLPVEYFNPFRNVQIDPAVSLEELAKVAHSMGEVVGLGLRNLAHCPVEMNLMPQSSLKRQEFNQKKPYLAASVLALILVLFAFGWFYGQRAAANVKAVEATMSQLAPLEAASSQLNAAMTALQSERNRLEVYSGWLEDRFYWSAVFMELRDIFLAVEDKNEKEFSKQPGVWIEKLQPCAPDAANTANAGGTAFTDAAATPTPPPPRSGRGVVTPRARVISSTDITCLKLSCRAVNLRLQTGQAAANSILIGSLVNEIQAHTNYFVPAGTSASGSLSGGENDLTVAFDLTVQLKR